MREHNLTLVARLVLGAFVALNGTAGEVSPHTRRLRPVPASSQVLGQLPFAPAPKPSQPPLACLGLCQTAARVSGPACLLPLVPLNVVTGRPACDGVPSLAVLAFPTGATVLSSLVGARLETAGRLALLRRLQ